MRFRCLCTRLDAFVGGCRFSIVSMQRWQWPCNHFSNNVSDMGPADVVGHISGKTCAIKRSTMLLKLEKQRNPMRLFRTGSSTQNENLIA